jgi:hypothetical protein
VRDVVSCVGGSLEAGGVVKFWLVRILSTSTLVQFSGTSYDPPVVLSSITEPLGPHLHIMHVYHPAVSSSSLLYDAIPRDSYGSERIVDLALVSEYT